MHLDERQPDHLLGQLDGVGDRRRRGDERRLRAVARREASQSTQHERHVRAEDAAIRVQLVDDHDLQAGEQAPPAAMVGQQAVVQDVGIRQQDRRRVARQALTLVARRVAGQHANAQPAASLTSVRSARS